MLEHFKIGELYVWDTDDIYGIERSLAAPPGPSLRHGDMFIYLGEAIDQKDPGFIKFKILIKRQVRTATIIEPKADWLKHIKPIKKNIYNPTVISPNACLVR